MFAVMGKNKIEIMVDLVEMTRKDFESYFISFLKKINSEFDKLESVEDIQLDYFS